MEEGYVRCERKNGISTIEFFHPLSNSLPGNLLKELTATIKAEDHTGTAVIVLKSAGHKAFCAGASFNELAAIYNPEQGTVFFSGFANVINAMRTSRKLIITRVQGKCVGGGVGIVAASDYSIAAAGADVKLSELAIGIGPFVIGPAVERKIGTASFAELAIDAGSWRTAPWALEKGLFNELQADEQALDERVQKMADTLAHYNPEAMAELKNILWSGTQHWDTLLAERAAMSGKLVLSEFTKAAIAKFKK